MKQYSSILEAKVGAKNSANQAAREMIPKIQAALEPFIGQRVTLQSGTLADKVRKALPPEHNTVDLSSWYHGGDYSISVRFKTCVQHDDNRGGHVAKYAETLANVAEVSDHKLTKLITGHEFPIYGIPEILQAREELKAAKRAVLVAENKLADFGEYDV